MSHLSLRPICLVFNLLAKNSSFIKLDAKKAPSDLACHPSQPLLVRYSFFVVSKSEPRRSLKRLRFVRMASFACGTTYQKRCATPPMVKETLLHIHFFFYSSLPTSNNRLYQSWKSTKHHIRASQLLSVPPYGRFVDWCRRNRVVGVLVIKSEFHESGCKVKAEWQSTESPTKRYSPINH